MAKNLAVAKSALESIARDVARRHVQEVNGDLILPSDLPEDNELIPQEIMYRLRKAAIQWVAGAEYPPRSEAMTELDIAINEGKTHTVAGCVFTLSSRKRGVGARWRITREFNVVKDLRGPTEQPWDGRWVLDGPHAPELEIRALGEAVKDTSWRETGMPRVSLMASPAVWKGDELIAAPIAGLENGWRASATCRGSFAEFLLSR